jgi:hypothetical protein
MVSQLTATRSSMQQQQREMTPGTAARIATQELIANEVQAIRQSEMFRVAMAPIRDPRLDDNLMY